ncbi:MULTISPECIES: DUF4175 family protein [unclassified Saccharibacter]|uniref:DUF4175 family protein n=1 Tax=unclassified Saccharibacter TaxID=2648722 RepID=UPI00132C2567|nr:MULTISPECIES: DUF4175 family protein [unclassified Saccharibacter]MXV36244.1 DUF4175 family protein [Saccharibacter sp. EH611]MXV57104.1 DUF4175 family protein [Saccharibacter sp. EH70]MXV66536.1 DUF4175 family protein [Saccharibacter sp. EH60]
MKARSLSRLAALRRKAHRVLRLEQLWSELRWPLLLLIIWVGTSLLHIPQSLPDSLHALLEGGVLVVILYILHRRIQGLPPLTPQRVDARIESDSALPFQPLSTLGDKPVGAAHNDHHQLIWAHHQSRALDASQELRVHWPRFFATYRSKSIAALILLALGGTFYISNPHCLSRLRAGFLPGTDDDSIALPHVQAWVDSPTYAPSAPLFLGQDAHPSKNQLAAGAMLHVVITDSNGPPVLHGASVQRLQKLSSQSWQLEASLQHSGIVSLHVRGRTLSRWQFSITEDHPPQLSWIGKPGAQNNGWQTRFPWKAEQSYGLRSLEVELSLSPRQHNKLHKQKSIRVPLPLDGTPKHAESQTTLDLSDSPFAGMKVQGTLHARSLSGLEGTSPTVTFTLGARHFTDPLARALVTLRQQIALGSEDIFDGQRDLALLTALPAPRDVQVPLTVINTLFQTHASLPSLEEQLWFLALYVEDRAQNGLVMAASMAEVRAAQQDAQQQITAMGAAHPPTEEQQQELHKRLKRVETALTDHMQLMIQKANQSGIVMPLPNGKNAPWTRLSKHIERDTRHNKTARASARLREMVEMAEQIRQANMGDMQSLAQQMAARAEATAQKAALSNLIKRETQLLNQTQARLAIIHQKIAAMQETNDVGQMSTSDLLRQLGMAGNSNTPPSSSSEDAAQLDDATHQRFAQERQNNHGVQYALRVLDDILAKRGKDLTGKENKSLNKASTDMGTVLQELAQRHDDNAAVAERKVLEDLSQARDEMKKNQSSSQKNHQGRLGFIPPPQPNQGQGQDQGQSDEQEGGSQGSGSLQQGQEDQDQDLDDQSDDDSDNSQGDEDKSEKKNHDPLGRKMPNGPETDAHIPDHDQDRTRAIQRELERRAADRTRPQSELDYLNRLLAPLRQTP